MEIPEYICDNYFFRHFIFGYGTLSKANLCFYLNSVISISSSKSVMDPGGATRSAPHLRVPVLSF